MLRKEVLSSPNLMQDLKRNSSSPVKDLLSEKSPDTKQKYLTYSPVNARKGSASPMLNKSRTLSPTKAAELQHMLNEQMNEIKLVIFGSEQSGKSTFFSMLANKPFSNEYQPTSTEYSYTLNYSFKAQNVRVVLLDTSGDDGCFSLHSKWIQQSDGLIFACDLTNNNSFQLISLFHQSLVTNFPETYKPKIIVGLKADLKEQRTVTSQSLLDLGKKFLCPVIEISSKTNQNVNAGLDAILEHVMSFRYYDFFIRQKRKEKKEHIDPMLILTPVLQNHANWNFHGCRLLQFGLFLCRYTPGNLTLNNPSERAPTVFEFESPILDVRVDGNILYSTHENSYVQIIDILKRRSNAFRLPCDVTKDSIVLFDKKYMYSLNAKTKSLIVTELNFDKSKQIEVSLDSGKLMQILTEFSTAIDGKVILGSLYSIEVWEINFEEKSSKLVLQKANPQNANGARENFLKISWKDSKLVARTRSKCFIWQSSDPSNMIEFDVHEDDIITATQLSENYLFTGDNHGRVCLRSISDGKLMWTLNSVKSAKAKGVNLSLEHRVNAIEWAGRLVFVACEDSQVLVYDILQQNAKKPLAELKLNASCAVRALSIFGDQIVCQLVKHVKEGDSTTSTKGSGIGASHHYSKDENNRPTELIVWMPTFKQKTGGDTGYGRIKLVTKNQ